MKIENIRRTDTWSNVRFFASALNFNKYGTRYQTKTKGAERDKLQRAFRKWRNENCEEVRTVAYTGSICSDGYRRRYVDIYYRGPDGRQFVRSIKTRLDCDDTTEYALWGNCSK